jgi:hypothetical protein
LVVVLSMSLGHAIGMLAVALYALAIVVDIVRSDPNFEPVAVKEGDDSDSDAGADDRAPTPGNDAPPSSQS